MQAHSKRFVFFESSRLHVVKAVNLSKMRLAREFHGREIELVSCLIAKMIVHIRIFVDVGEVSVVACTRRT